MLHAARRSQWRSVVRKGSRWRARACARIAIRSRPLAHPTRSILSQVHILPNLRWALSGPLLVCCTSPTHAPSGLAHTHTHERDHDHGPRRRDTTKHRTARTTHKHLTDAHARAPTPPGRHNVRHARSRPRHRRAKRRRQAGQIRRRRRRTKRMSNEHRAE